MSLLDDCLDIIEPGYEARTAAYPHDLLEPARPVPISSCACGKKASGGGTQCWSCFKGKGKRVERVHEQSCVCGRALPCFRRRCRESPVEG